MARTIQKSRLNNRTAALNSTANPPTTAPQPHTGFMEVSVRTAKCDACDKRKNLTLYRCIECSQHVCSSCWNKPGDKFHLFGGGSRDVPDLHSDGAIADDNGDGEKGHENASQTRTRRRVHVVSDDEDDDFHVLKPAPRTGNAETTDASKQQSKKLNVIMNGDHHQDHENNLPRLWPIVGGLPVLRPTVPTANTIAAESANRVMQDNLQMHGEESNPECQNTIQVENLGRQTVPSQYPFAGNQETKPQAGHPSPSSISNQQATRSIPLHNEPAVYRPRPGTNVDLQAARNQLAFANTQLPNRQVSRPAQTPIASQQSLRRLQPAVYRPRPGADMDVQAARNEVASAPYQKSDNRQAPRPSQASVSHQQAVHLTPHGAQASVSIFQQPVQTTANMDRTAARDQQAFDPKQQAQAHTKPKQMEARNRLASEARLDARPAANRDQVTSHNQQTRVSPFPSQAFRSQQHAVFPASLQAQHQIATQYHSHGPSAGIQVQEYSPETIEAANALLFYAGVEHKSRDRCRSEQGTHGDSNLLSAARQPERPSSARSESLSSSPTLVNEYGAAGAQSTSPRDLASNPSPRDRDAASARARHDKHWSRPDELQSTSGTRRIVLDTPASQRGHPNHRHATLQLESGPTLTNSSAIRSKGSSSRPVQSHLGPKFPISDHAATYLNQWDSSRAALSAKSSSATVDVPAPHSEKSRSAVPAVSVLDITGGGKEPEKAAEAGTLASNTPISVAGRPSDIEIMMGNLEVEILEDDDSRHSDVRTSQNKPRAVGNDGHARKHSRGEKNEDPKTSKEHRVPGDIDVVNARRRNVKDEQPKKSDDEANDVETTSCNKLDSKRMTEDRRDVYAMRKEIKLRRIIKKGVAVKKPQPKGRKKTTPTHVG